MKTLTLSSCIEALQKNGLLLELIHADAFEEKKLDRITYNSKEAQEATLFVCKGLNFKAQYLDEAIDRGAFAYVSEKSYRNDVPALIVSDVRKTMAVLANLFYEEPWRSYQLTGITGTKGKSTVTHFLKAILDQEMMRLGEKPSGLVSSICIEDGLYSEEAHLTTPESLVLMKHLSNARSAGLKYLSMEVSSQALKYERVAGIEFDAAIFLNISEDHISPIEHPDYQDYLQAKLSLFKQAKHAVYYLNTADLEKVKAAARACPSSASYSLDNKKADYCPSAIHKLGLGYAFELELRGQLQHFELSNPGRFNIENALAAIAVADHYGISIEAMKLGLAKVRVSGRMENFSTADGHLHILVDYAHNALSFEQVFSHAKREFPDYRITAIFGSAGEKALQRRAKIGQIAAQMADRIILTTVDPGYENPAAIATEIGRSIEEKGGRYSFIEERKDALSYAVETREEKEVILMLGKGNEHYQKIGSEWVDMVSDLEVASGLIEALNNS